MKKAQVKADVEKLPLSVNVLNKRYKYINYNKIYDEGIKISKAKSVGRRKQTL